MRLLLCVAEGLTYNSSGKLCAISSAYNTSVFLFTFSAYFSQGRTNPTSREYQGFPMASPLQSTQLPLGFGVLTLLSFGVMTAMLELDQAPTLTYLVVYLHCLVRLVQCFSTSPRKIPRTKAMVRLPNAIRCKRVARTTALHGT